MKLTYQDSLRHFMDTFRKSEEQCKVSEKYIPGAYSRGTFNYGPHGVYVDHAEGAYIYTVEGNKLLDMNNNFTVSVLGYQNQKVDQAIKNTMERGFSLGNPTIEESELARMLCERVPSVEQTKFFCSASEACVGAIRIARAYTRKNKFANSKI